MPLPRILKSAVTTVVAVLTLSFATAGCVVAQDGYYGQPYGQSYGQSYGRGHVRQYAPPPPRYRPPPHRGHHVRRHGPPPRAYYAPRPHYVAPHVYAPPSFNLVVPFNMR